jgi:cytoskeletal protein CcmA (bactofilin family)
MRQALRPSERVGDAERTEKTASAEKPVTPVAMPSGTAEAVVVTPMTESLLAHPDKCSSVVSTGSTWDGTLTIEGSVRIDGSLSGEIEARGTVHVSKGAEVNAKVRAAYLVIAGTFHGEALCGERLEIMPTGHVTGELTTKSLVVHEGSFLEGQLRMTNGPAAKSDAPAKGANGVNGATRAFAKPADSAKATSALASGESA